MNPQLLHIDLENVVKSGIYDRDQITQIFIKSYVQIVKDWDLPDSKAERMLDIDSQTWMYIKEGKWNGPLNEENLTRIGEIASIYDALLSGLGGKAANRWATKPSKLSMFNGRSPVDAMIQEGRPMMERTQRYTHGLLTGR